MTFTVMLARMVSNPIGSRGRNFSEEPIVIYDFGLQTVFVMDPQLIQDILLDDAESHGKKPDR